MQENAKPGSRAPEGIAANICNQQDHYHQTPLKPTPTPKPTRSLSSNTTGPHYSLSSFHLWDAAVHHGIWSWNILRFDQHFEIWSKFRDVTKTQFPYVMYSLWSWFDTYHNHLYWHQCSKSTYIGINAHVTGVTDKWTLDNRNVKIELEFFENSQ